MPLALDDEEEIDSALEHTMFQNLFPVGEFFGFRPRAILCLPANPGQTMGNDSNYDAAQSGNLNAFKKTCKELACGVLFDSAVGNQLTANWSKQFREGTNRFFDEYDSKAHSKKIIVIPNVVPTESLQIKDGDKTHNYPEYAKKRILADFSDNFNRGHNTYYLDLLAGDKFGVPKIDRFMWQEGVLKNETNLSPEEHVALDCYREIAAIIANN